MFLSKNKKNLIGVYFYQKLSTFFTVKIEKNLLVNIL